MINDDTKLIPVNRVEVVGQRDTTVMAAKTNTQMDDPRFRIRPMQQIASACTGAMLTACFMTPLDVVKTRIQAQQAKMTNKCFLYCNGLMDHLCPCDAKASFPEVKPIKPLTGTVDAFFHISRTEGIRSLWSGLGPTLISALPSTIIYFVGYEQFKRKFLEFHYEYLAEVKGSPIGREVPLLVPLIAGITARICAVTCVNPVELIRTKMQSEKMTYAQITSAIQKVVQSQGIWGLWRGLRPTILRDVPFSGLYWTCYETIKSHYGVIEPTFGFSFLAGAVSGSIAATITTPFDVIKTHEQIEFGEKVIFAEKPVKQLPTASLGKRLATIYATNGVPGLFAGLGPRLLKVAPACAIMISTFEYSKAFFYHYNVEQYSEH
ncbi:probable mitochondrial glutathione transporter SLC25A40 [Stomoxys calcitrans]|uniref:probable mitochondrial glutathione transporter SLC25A40 n=1 Tax=Stomoxys calcitrans TaxID=35570 RepID=UPI0027E2487F|nr:probable mitochondrial glutathione transporter SLC25A40 [Stomoxys calcitrans]XP_013111022.2 probable mitochondrial glutathione transporter SLC25A40 [Stomoxys calcitrans]XP_059224134.1 probable mitochondrial glutathione transporter SLC25A40 [Stomoxys calcitrans]XP_059224135.1 probable mitochondrial glutathione transporter SLC25A40 [Stomoxys calcitrans]XP_059224136.1 probable mitochondrial glutathione transporter SLC25A40 [Stomoxys calcitrans]